MLLKRHPELQGLASPKEAKEVVRAWQKQLMKSPKFGLALVVYSGVIGATAMAILVSIRRLFYFPSSMYGGVVGGITGGTGVIAINWFWRNRLRRYLREQLVARGQPICLKCGYDLRGQIEARCPECGTPCDPGLLRMSEE